MSDLGQTFRRLARQLAAAVAAELAAKGFNPNQPRVPAGSPDGGQWTSGGNRPPGVRKPPGGPPSPRQIVPPSQTDYPDPDKSPLDAKEQYAFREDMNLLAKPSDKQREAALLWDKVNPNLPPKDGRGGLTRAQWREVFKRQKEYAKFRRAELKWLIDRYGNPYDKTPAPDRPDWLPADEAYQDRFRQTYLNKWLSHHGKNRSKLVLLRALEKMKLGTAFESSGTGVSGADSGEPGIEAGDPGGAPP